MFPQSRDVKVPVPSYLYPCSPLSIFLLSLELVRVTLVLLSDVATVMLSASLVFTCVDGRGIRLWDQRQTRPAKGKGQNSSASPHRYSCTPMPLDPRIGHARVQPERVSARKKNYFVNII